MLNIDTTGVGAGQIAYQLFIRGWILEGIVFKDFQEELSFWPKA